MHVSNPPINMIHDPITTTPRHMHARIHPLIIYMIQSPQHNTGKARAKRTPRSAGRDAALCLQIHGDAAMSGQVRMVVLCV